MRRGYPTPIGRFILRHPVGTGAVLLASVVALASSVPDVPRVGEWGTWVEVVTVGYMLYGVALAWFGPRVVRRTPRQAVELGLAGALLPAVTGWLGWNSGAPLALVFVGAAASSALVVLVLVRAVRAPG